MSRACTQRRRTTTDPQAGATDWLDPTTLQPLERVMVFALRRRKPESEVRISPVNPVLNHLRREGGVVRAACHKVRV